MAAGLNVGGHRPLDLGRVHQRVLGQETRPGADLGARTASTATTGPGSWRTTRSTELAREARNNAGRDASRASRASADAPPLGEQGVDERGVTFA
jgi:hypothetical protein